MKVLFSYTLNTIRRNKNTSLSIMAAVLLSSTLLSALCIYGYTELKWRIEIEEYEGGEWHGELGGEILAEQLGLVDNNLHMEATMIKGPFSCLKLPEDSALPYLLLRDADESYWSLMGEKNVIMEGRVPARVGEIAVSKSFFEKNPRYRLGDTITLPKGERYLEGEPLDESKIWREKESFCQTGEEEVTLVGKLDVTTNTSIPGYYAMGYLDRASLSGKEELVVYVKMRDIRKTYEIMPQIAEELGIKKDEYGRYDNHFRYNVRLLALNFVFPPEAVFTLESLDVLLAYGMILLLALGAFVMIIHGAFQVSASARMKQLGMFRSVGASPRQIALSILFEGLILSALPILLGVGLGFLFTAAVMELYTKIAGELLYFPITVRISPLLVLICIGSSLLTVLTAAWLPALRIARLSPLEVIRMEEKKEGKLRRAVLGRRGRRKDAGAGALLRRKKKAGGTDELLRGKEKSWQEICPAQALPRALRIPGGAGRGLPPCQQEELFGRGDVADLFPHASCRIFCAHTAQ